MNLLARVSKFLARLGIEFAIAGVDFVVIARCAWLIAWMEPAGPRFGVEPVARVGRLGAGHPVLGLLTDTGETVVPYHGLFDLTEAPAAETQNWIDLSDVIDIALEYPI